MSIDSINARDLFEKGALAYLSQDNQNKSYVHTAKLSGMHKPWSIGTIVHTFLPVFLSTLV